MKVTVKERDVEHKTKVEEGSKVEDVLDRVGINMENVLVELDGELVCSQEEVGDRDVLETTSIVSMG